MLTDTLFLGKGPGLFALNYPNDDFVRSERHFGPQPVLTPHNAYIQMAYGTGVVSLVCFLFLLGWVTINCLRARGLCVVFLVGVLAYSIARMVNDSVVSVTPVFWVLFGCVTVSARSDLTSPAENS